MSFIATAGYIVGGVVLAILIALPLMMFIWYRKIKKIKKKAAAYLEDLKQKLETQNLRKQQQEIRFTQEEARQPLEFEE